MRAIAAMTLALAVMGCGGTALAPSTAPSLVGAPSSSPPLAPTEAATIGASDEPTATATEDATAAPTVAPTATAEPTPTPTTRPTPEPQPTANAEKGDTFIRLREDNGYVRGQIILEVINTGGTWVEMSPFQSSYTVFDESGGITEAQSFFVAAPELLPPGETGYLFADIFTDEYDLEDYARVEADGYYDEADEPDAMLTVENTRVRNDRFAGVGVNGLVRNPGAERIDSVSVAAVFLNAQGDPLGAAYAYAENVEPGGTRGFEATSEAPPNIDAIADTKFFASDAGF